ncbi:MAG TPA: DUF3987 domain-containing protein [Edaphobacter sp.]|nr:DUF3987 domain-containing protein [Edaphobacter sp.]
MTSLVQPITSHIPSVPPPDDLVERDQWVNWAFEERNGKRTKMPLQPNGKPASSTDPNTWSRYEEVKRAWEQNPGWFDGVGFVFSEDDPFVGIDFDDSLDADGEVREWAQSYVSQFADCYTEVSPSGRGLKIFARAENGLPGKGKRMPHGPYIDGKPDHAIEIYSQGRFFTVTGQAFRNSPSQLEDHQADIEKLHAEISAPAGGASANGSLAKPRLVGEQIPEGRRHPYLASIAGSARGRGVGDAAIEAMLWAENVEKCGQKYDRAHIRKIVESTRSWRRDPELLEESSAEAEEKDPWAEYTPLESHPVAKFESGTFPGFLGPMIDGIVGATEAPAELAAAMALGIVAMALGGKIEVAPTDNPDYRETTNLYICAAMEPGNRKSSVLNHLAEPIIEWEVRQSQAFPYRQQRISERKTLEAQIENLRKKKQSNDEPIDALHARIRELEEKLPDIPALPQLWSQDVTPEHLGTKLAEQNGRLALLSAEGGLFENFAGRYSKSGTPNLDLILQAYDGSPVRVERAGRTVYLSKPTLTIAISPQPDVLKGMQNHQEMKSRGLVGRFLYALPSSPVGYRECVTTPIPHSVRANYRQGITALLDTPTQLDSDGRIIPEVLTFSRPAKDLWWNFQKSVERDMREGGRLAHCKDWGAKLPGKVARIAACMYAVTYPWHDRPLDIQVEEVATAIKIAEVLTSHALAVFGLMNVDPTVDQALKIVAWLKAEQKELFTVREVFRRFERLFSRKAAMLPALDLLVEHSYIRPLGKTPGTKTEVYSACPRVLGYVE